MGGHRSVPIDAFICWSDVCLPEANTINNMRSILAVLLIFLTSISSFAQSEAFFEEADEFFKEYVKDGKVDYDRLKNESSEVEKLVNMIMSQPKLEGDEQKAFLINAYNILAIKMALDNYPNSDSVLSVDGFFDSEVFEVNNERVSLDKLEKQQLQEEHSDPLLHLSLVCSANGCPRLPSRAYTPNGLNAQLEEQARMVINDTAFTKVDEKTGQLQLSQIFEWYEDDFGGKEGVMEFIEKYYNGKIKDKNNYGHYEYDWSINKAE